jgi:hypothetical protein
MVEEITVRIVSKPKGEPPEFEVGYYDLDRKDQKGYIRTTKYGTEVEMRTLLAACGVPDGKVDRLFFEAR